MKLANMERVTVTLSTDLVRDLDRREKNRNKFIAGAVRHKWRLPSARPEW